MVHAAEKLWHEPLFVYKVLGMHIYGYGSHTG